ncbi:MAG: hypothetical protein QXO75_07625 [Nitrososphaerota archaeon]
MELNQQLSQENEESRTIGNIVKDSLKDISPIILISIFYIFVIIFYTHGRLLYSADYPGFYNLYDSSDNVISTIIWDFSYISSAGNIYATYYFHLFLTTLFASVSFYYLSELLFTFREPFTKKFYGYIAVILFLINPWLVQNTFQNLSITVNSTFFNLFLIGIFLFISPESGIKKKTIAPLVSGIGLGLSLPIFPNYVRLFLLAILVLVALDMFALYLKIRFKSTTFRYYLYFTLVTVAIAILISLEEVLPIIGNPSSIIATANAGYLNKVYLGFYTGEFNTVINTLRGLNSWQLPGIFYFKWYENYSLFYVSTFLWPVLALIVPIWISRFRDKTRIFFIVSALLIVVFWDKGDNSPFGSLWMSVNKYLPYGYQLFPTGLMSSLFLDRFYPILISYSIVVIYLFLRKETNTRKNDKRHFSNSAKSKSILPIFVAILIVLILLTAALPFFDGYAENTAYNGDGRQGGFYVPISYFEMRDYLLAINQKDSNTLLLPPTGSNPYIITSWNYTGEIAFYGDFFAPARIITLNNFGGTYNSPSEFSQYLNLTAPSFEFSNASKSDVTSYLNELMKYNISYILLDSSIIAGNYNSYNYSYLLVRDMEEFGDAKLLFSAGPLTLVGVANKHNLDTEEPTGSLENNPSLNTENYKIKVVDLNATINNDSGSLDVGNFANISLIGQIPIYSQVKWYLNDTYLGEGINIIKRFSVPGVYKLTAELIANNTIYATNYTIRINPSMRAYIYAPTVMIAGQKIYFSGGVTGGTIFPNWAYTWTWYLNGVYMKDVGDSSFHIPLILNKTGSYKLELVVYDALGEKKCVAINILVVSKVQYLFTENFNVSTALFWAISFSLIIGIIFFGIRSRRHTVTDYESGYLKNEP